MVDEHQDGGDKADRPDAHHDQVPALAVSDVRGEAWTRLSDQVRLVMAESSSCLHVSTLFRCQADRHTDYSPVSMAWSARPALPDPGRRRQQRAFHANCLK
jgi:hypothetical protein